MRSEKARGMVIAAFMACFFGYLLGSVTRVIPAGEESSAVERMKAQATKSPFIEPENNAFSQAEAIIANANGSKCKSGDVKTVLDDFAVAGSSNADGTLNKEAEIKPTDDDTKKAEWFLKACRRWMLTNMTTAASIEKLRNSPVRPD